jgi:hypothetical protein
MDKKYCFVVTPTIESACCVLLFKWLTGKTNITTVVSSEDNLLNDLRKLDFTNFNFVYLIGYYNLDKVPESYNNKKFYFINKIFKTKPNFELINCIEGNSTTLTVFYNFLKKYTTNELKNNQKIIYDSVNNYLTYNFNDLLPIKLFYFFKTLPSLNKVETFIKRFESGLIMFTDEENKKMNIVISELSNTLKKIHIYHGKINFNNIDYTVGAAFGSKFINEVSSRIQKTTNCDISIVIDMEKKAVFFRKNKTVKVDLGDLAHKCFSGYGTEYAAFANLNEKIIELTKSFYSK